MGSASQPEHRESGRRSPSEFAAVDEEVRKIIRSLPHQKYDVPNDHADKKSTEGACANPTCPQHRQKDKTMDLIMSRIPPEAWTEPAPRFSVATTATSSQSQTVQSTARSADYPCTPTEKEAWELLMPVRENSTKGAKASGEPSLRKKVEDGSKDVEVPGKPTHGKPGGKEDDGTDQGSDDDETEDELWYPLFGRK